MGPAAADRRDRLWGALLALAVQGAIGWALIVGLGVSVPMVRDAGLKLFGVAPPPPPPERVVPPPVRNARPEGRAAPPNLRARPKAVTAPVPVVPPPLPVIVAPPKAADGAAPTAGAADRRGPGTGAGGEGDGLGGGGDGDGDGGGWDETPPRHISGRLRDADFPEDLADAGVSGTVGVRYVVQVDGRVGECRVTRSSGNRTLDALTCRLIRERFRFRPSLDGAGRPVASAIVENHSWDVERVGD